MTVQLVVDMSLSRKGSRFANAGGIRPSGPQSATLLIVGQRKCTADRPERPALSAKGAALETDIVNRCLRPEGPAHRSATMSGPFRTGTDNDRFVSRAAPFADRAGPS